MAIDDERERRERDTLFNPGDPDGREFHFVQSGENGMPFNGIKSLFNVDLN